MGSKARDEFTELPEPKVIGTKSLKKGESWSDWEEPTMKLPSWEDKLGPLFLSLKDPFFVQFFLVDGDAQFSLPARS